MRRLYLLVPANTGKGYPRSGCIKPPGSLPVARATCAAKPASALPTPMPSSTTPSTPRSITWLKIPGSVGPLNDPGASDSPDSGAKHHRPIRPGDTRPAGHAVTDREKPDHRQSPGHHSFRRLLEPCAYDVRPPRDPGGRLTARVVWPIPPPPAPTAVRADR